MGKQVNHDKFHDESLTRTHRLSRLPHDGDPCVVRIKKSKAHALYEIKNISANTNIFHLECSKHQNIPECAA